MADVKKRRDLSLKEKINILKEFDKLPKLSQRNAATLLKISQPVLCKILKNRVEIEDAAKKMTICTLKGSALEKTFKWNLH